ncbi:MAG TPA: glycosyltransferase family 9 protein [Candidatus Eisenbacteria bacterium]|nr:glycosyltransferase family 9 protein [Candidatus Eisenbacteria bacterium]
MEDPKRILVTRIRQIGDVILTLPVLDALRARFPDAEIDYLAEVAPAQAAMGHPALRRVLALRKWPGLPAPPLLLAALRRARYDWVIDLYGNPRSALLTRVTGAPVRVGPARRSRRQLYTHAIPAQDPQRSAIDYHLSALRAIGVTPAQARMPRLHLSDVERAEGAAYLDQAAPPGGPRVGLHVGNRWSAKRWPEERFAALLRALSKLGARGVVLAGPGEEALARRVAEGARTAGRAPAPVISGLPLRSYFAVVASLDALVTNDGSPLHVGPAVQVPTVGILGPTVPEIWFPYAREEGHQLLCKPIWCRPCHRHECARLDCLEWVEVGEALRATESALAHGGRVRATA